MGILNSLQVKACSMLFIGVSGSLTDKSTYLGKAEQYVCQAWIHLKNGGWIVNGTLILNLLRLVQCLCCWNEASMLVYLV